jgi:hypothetical protein
MLLSLDHTQRLNLHALLGAQRGDLAAIRAFWAIQDRIGLDAEEEKAIELKREFVAGQDRVVWNPANELPTKQFDFGDAEVGRIRAALETWVSYGVNVDRRWLEPLLAAIATTGTCMATSGGGEDFQRLI